MRLLSPFAAVLCARNFQMWRQPMVKSLTKGIRLELHLKIGEHVYRQSEDIKSHSPPQTRNKKTASYLVTAQKSPLRVIYLQCSQFGRHVSLISSGEWEREQERDQMWFRSGAVRPVEMVKWDLDTGWPQDVYRCLGPCCGSDLKQAFSLKSVHSWEGSADDTIPITGYWVTDDLSHFLWCSISPSAVWNHYELLGCGVS